MPHIHLPRLNRRRFLAFASGAGVSLIRAAETASHWAILSDTHIPADPADTYRGFRPFDNLKKILPDVLASQPEGLVICGDLARLEGKAADYANLKAILQPALDKIPVVMALGNHDDRQNFIDTFPALPGSQKAKNKHISVFETPAVRFIVLDSLILPNTTPGLLGKGQRVWLDNYLGACTPLPTIVFVHHTLTDDDGALQDTPWFFDILRKHAKVKAVFYGHSHEYKYEVKDSLHLVNIPAVAYNFNDREPLGWFDAHFSPHGAQLTLKAFAGNLSKHNQTLTLNWSI
jgi:3',5'-cyclic AMP phosphodiesterase CpdA